MKRAQISTERKAELVPLKGVGEKSPLKIDNSEFTIGRSKNASFILKDLKISRNHCVISFKNGSWNICAQSSCGTFLNDKKLTKDVPYALKSGDIVSLGFENEYLYIFRDCEGGANTMVKKMCSSSLPEPVKTTAIKESAPSHRQKQLPQKTEQTLDESFHMETEDSQFEANLLIGLEKIDKSIPPAPVKTTAVKESALSHKQKKIRQKIEQTQHETSIMETQHLQLEANLLNGLEKIDKRYEAEQASLLRSAHRHDKRRLQEEREALERQLWREKAELERSTKARMEELQRRIGEKQQAEMRLAAENQALQDELHKERALFKERLEKEEQQVQLERKRVEELVQKHEETIASLEEVHTIAGLLQEQELAEKSKAYEEEKKTIQSALMEKEKALEVTEEKLKKEGEVRSKFQDVLESELQCSVCNELFVCATTLNCTHTFCQLCITQWKERKHDCPVCRAKITSETRMLILDGFIDKAVENLSEEMKKRRNEIVEEKKIAMSALQQKPKASSSTGPRRNTRQNNRTTRASNRARAAPVEISSDGEADEDSIYVSSEEGWISLSDTDSNSSVEGEPGEYYGGYGYCYRCGRRGHWARGCPN
ncbi:E3 ubiquitin-protein ligase RNF8-like isoform X1 [Bacillus rossius redtenbacheri]|uniref:E3 ubiquitin-protein ligase RNF8-like isoform X1 n=1 Tax=Bacillus rossius redtenbacheri TaxID=93214 RepID=UPI002FDCD726